MRRLRPPFFSRAYGGYTKEQEAFYRAQLGDPQDKTILDPMGGQGYLIADLAYEGANVWLLDINPALTLLASLRSPELVEDHRSLTKWLKERIGRVNWRAAPGFSREFVPDWLDQRTRENLARYRELCRILRSPFTDGEAFWSDSRRVRFAAAMPILAARELACFRASDNQTWVKKGGLERDGDFGATLLRALTEWEAYSKEIVKRGNTQSSGSLTVRRNNAADGRFTGIPMVDAVITSPPYANRLDYTRMWGPESEVAAGMWGSEVDPIARSQIGSNVVRGTAGNETEVANLPRTVQQSLQAIRDDSTSYASSDYYYPFFRNYAIGLAAAVRGLARKVRVGGCFVVLIRDTVRKDILFPSGALVEEILKESGFTAAERRQKIIKRHVGLRRRQSTDGLYGIGQQEWWISYKKVRR